MIDLLSGAGASAGFAVTNGNKVGRARGGRNALLGSSAMVGIVARGALFASTALVGVTFARPAAAQGIQCYLVAPDNGDGHIQYVAMQTCPGGGGSGGPSAPPPPPPPPPPTPTPSPAATGTISNGNGTITGGGAGEGVFVQQNGSGGTTITGVGITNTGNSPTPDGLRARGAGGQGAGLNVATTSTISSQNGDGVSLIGVNENIGFSVNSGQTLNVTGVNGLHLSSPNGGLFLGSVGAVGNIVATAQTNGTGTGVLIELGGSVGGSLGSVSASGFATGLGATGNGLGLTIEGGSISATSTGISLTSTANVILDSQAAIVAPTGISTTASTGATITTSGGGTIDSTSAGTGTGILVSSSGTGHIDLNVGAAIGGTTAFGNGVYVNATNPSTAYVDLHTTAGITAATTSATNYGVYISTYNSYANRGTIDIGANVTGGSGVYTQAGVYDYIVRAGATVTAGATNGMGFVSGNSGSTFNNAGTVQATGTGGDALEFYGIGTVVNQATGIISGAAKGLSLLNSPTSINNAGSILGGTSAGIYGAMSSNTVNTGSITGNWGIYGTSNPLTLNNSGTITGVIDGVNQQAGSARATITNSGTINTTGGAGSAAGIYFLSSNTTNTNTVNNTGTITGGTDATYGYGVSNDAAAPLVVNNNSGGVIGGGTGAIRLSGTGAQTLNLNGGSTTGAIFVGNSGSVTATVAGTVTGNYVGTAGTGTTIFNLASGGAIQGASFGTGTTTFNWTGGTIAGPVSTTNGGFQNLNVNLGAGNSGTIGGLSRFFVNANSGTVTLTGSDTTALKLAGGNIVVDTDLAVGATTSFQTTPGSTLTVNSGRSLTSSSGTVQLNVAGTVTNAGTISGGQSNGINSTFYFYGVSNVASGTVINNSGTIAVGEYNLVAGIQNASNVQINNTGIIRAGAISSTHTTDGIRSYGGTVTIANSTAGSIIAGGEGGIITTGGTVALTNAGYVVGATNAINATGAVNITNNAGATIGTGQVTNAGVFTVGGSGNAVIIAGGTISNRGTINGAAGGLQTTGGTLNLTNFSGGLITGQGTGTGNFDGVTVNAATTAATLLNAGQIVGAAYAGIYSASTATTITNAAGGVLTGGGSGPGVNLDAGGTFTNYGTANGGAGVNANGTANISLRAGSTSGNIVTTGNGNTVLAIYSGRGTTGTATVDTPSGITLQNAGTLAAATFGTIALGGSSDELQLRGTGDGSLANGTAGNFSIATSTGAEILTKAGTGTWTLTGAAIMPAIAINAGTGGAPASGGLLVFSGTTGLTGTINVNGATIRATTAGAFGTGTITATDPTIQYGATGTYTNPIVLASSDTVNDPTRIQADAGINATLTGLISQSGAPAQPLIFDGAGTITLTNGGNNYAGLTTISNGTVVQSNTASALGTGGVLVNSGAVLAFNNQTGGTLYVEGGTYSGAGTLRFNGNANSVTAIGYGGNGNTVISLASGGLIDVVSGYVNGSSSNQGLWTGNKGDLSIATGATFDGVEGNIIVDALNGTGTLRGGYGSVGSTTIGADNGSGIFSGTIANGSSALVLIKTGTGTQTLSGTNSYTGLTSITGGTLVVQGGSSIVDTNIVDVGAAGTFAVATAETIGNLTGSGATTLTSDLTLAAASGSYAGTVTGNGILNIASGTKTLTGTLTNAGGLALGTSGNATIGSTGSVSNASANGAIQVNGAGDIVTIAAGGSVTSTATSPVNSAGITGTATFTVINAGTIQGPGIDSAGQFGADGIYAQAGLTLNNTGTIYGVPAGNLTSTVVNAGVIVFGNADLTNSGTIWGGGTGAFLAGGGSLTNSGTITANVYGGAEVGGTSLTSTVSNLAGGIIQGNYGLLVDGGSWTVSNAAGAQVTGAATSILSRFGAGLVVDNSGQITGASGYGIQASGNGPAYNIGASANYTDANGNPYTAVITNRSGGQIVGAYTGLETAQIASITNAGLIGSGTYNLATSTYTQSGTDGIRLLGGGTVTNNSGGSIMGSAGAGIYAESATTATIVNSGTISATQGIFTFGANNQAINVTNNAGGLIYATNGIGVYQGGGGALTVTNSAGGTIVASGGDAVHDDGFGLTTIVNGGTIVGQASGLATNGAVDITNTGLIGSGTLANGTSGAFTANGQYVGISTASGGTIRNNGGSILGGNQAGIYSNSGTLSINNSTATSVVSGTIGVQSLGTLSLTSSGTISGSAGTSIQLTGTGNTVTLNAGSTTTGNIVASGTTGVNNYTVGGTLTGGLVAGSGNDTVTFLTSGNFTGQLNGGAGTDAFILDGTGTSSLNLGGITNFESLTKNGTGTFTLNGTASGTTGWTINAGTLNANGGNALADQGRVTVNAGGTLGLLANETAGSLAGAGNVSLGGNTLTLGGDNSSSTFSGTASGAGGLTKVGTGVFTLSGANSFTGNVLVSAGTLAYGANNVLADTVAVTVNSGATFDLNGHSDTIGTLNLYGTLANGGLLTAGRYNAYTGSTIGQAISSGTLNVYGDTSLTAATAAAPVNIYSGTLTTGAANLLSDTGAVLIAAAGALALGGDETIGSLADLNGAGGTVQLAGHVLTVGGDASSTTFSGVIQSNAAGGGLTKSGAGTFTLTGANTFAGTTTVFGGTLALGGGNALADTSAVLVNAGGTLALLASETIGSLAGAGAVSLDVNTLNVGGDNSNTTYAGVASGTGGLTKIGTGTLTLSGANAYTGTTSVQGGTLALGASDVLADASTLLVTGATFDLGANSDTIDHLVMSGGMLNGTGTLTSANSLQGYTLTDATINANLGTGALVIASGNTSTLLNGTAASSTVEVQAGALTLGASDRLADAATVSVDTGATLALGAFTDTVGALQLTGTLNGTGTLTAATYTLTGGTANANLGAGVLTQTSGSSTLNGTSAAASVNVTGGTLTLGANNRLADAAAVVVASGAELALGTNSDTVGSLALSGTLSGTGTLTAATYALTGGTANANLGAGTLNQTSGTSTLNGTSAATSVNVNGGTLTLGSSNRLADAAAVAVGSGATLALGANSDTVGTLTLGGTVSGTGTLTAATYALTGGTANANLGAGTLNQVTGTSTLNGTSAAASVNVTGGTLALGSSNRLADVAAVTVASGAELALGANSDTVGALTLGGTLSGTGTLTAATYALTGGTANANFGAGTLNQVTGTSTLNGTSAAASVNVNGGTLTLGSSNRLADAAAVSVASAAELALGANSDTVGALTLGGTLSGSGTLTAATYALTGGTANANLGAGTLNQTSGTSTLNGTSAATSVNVTGGTLTLGASNRLADTAAVAVGTGATLNLGANSDTVGSFALSGTLAGTGTLTAATYTLNNAAVNANLGTGTLVQAGGTSTLGGTAAATSVNVTGGTLTLGASNRLATTAAVQIASAATFNLANFNQSVATVGGNGTLALGSGTLTVGGGNADFGYAGTISGSGDVTKTGTGTFTLVGTDSMTGRLNVNAGTLAFGATSAGSARIQGGTLTGGGTFAGNLLLASGTLSPGVAGQPIGTIQVGSFTGTGGTFAVDFTGSAGGFTADRLAVTGTAALSGGVVVPTAAEPSANYRMTNEYRILQAGTLSGTFGNGTTFAQVAGSSDLYWRLRYDLVPNAVLLEVRKVVDFTAGLGSGASGNQLGVAAALNGSALTGSDSYIAALDAITALTPAQRAATYDSIGGEAVADITTSLSLVGNRFSDMLRERLTNGSAINDGNIAAIAAVIDGTAGSGALRQAAPVLGNASRLVDDGAHINAWLQGYGASGSIDGRAGTAKVTDFAAGAAAGVELQGETFKIGVAGTITDLEANARARLSRNTGTIYQGGGYVAYDNGATFANAIGSYFGGTVNTARSVFVGTTLFGKATGHAASTGYSASASLGHRFDLGNGVLVTPQVSGEAVHVTRNAFTETGAGVLSLAVARETRDLYSAIGELRVSHKGVTAGGGVVEPYASIGVRVNLGDLDTLSAMRFTGAPTGTGAFTIAGAQLAKTSALFTGGIDAHPSDNVTLGVELGGSYARQQREGRVSMNVKIGF